MATAGATDHAGAMTQTTDHETGAPRGPVDDLAARLRASGYHREPAGRWFGGVCSGLAARFGVDPLLIRAAAVVLVFAGGLGFLAYLALWLVLPDRDGVILLERAVRGGDGGAIVLTVVTGLALVGTFASVLSGDWSAGPLWVLLPLAGIAWFLVTRRRQREAAGWAQPGWQQPGYQQPNPPQSGWPQPGAQPSATTAGAPVPPPPAPTTPSTPTPGGDTVSAPTTSYAPATHPAGPPVPPPPAGPGTPWGGHPAPPAPPRFRGPVGPPPPPAPRRRPPSAFVGLVSLGLVIALLGLGSALDSQLDLPGHPAVLGLGLALAGVSVIALVLGARGRRSGFTGFLVIALATILPLAFASSRVPVGDGLGDRTWTPTSSAELSLGAGDAVLDLSRMPARAGTAEPARVSVRMGAGDLTVDVPAGLTVRVESHVGVGDIRTVGGSTTDPTTASGTDRDLTTTVGAGTAPDVVVTAEVGLGQITIEEN